jgi:hypothetical protein
MPVVRASRGPMCGSGQGFAPLNSEKVPFCEDQRIAKSVGAFTRAGVPGIWKIASAT